MKKFYSCLVMMLLVCVMFFSACGGVSPMSGDHPETDKAVLGNGGYSVIKDGYMYFVNGYLESTDYDEMDENKLGSVEKGAIYRTKLDKDGKLIKDEYGFLAETMPIVKKVVGFDKGQFYILGDYIYYTTPHNQKDETGMLRSDFIDICRIRIDGNVKTNEKIYTATDISTELDWSVYTVADKTYVAVKECGTENTIKVIDVKSKKQVTKVEKFLSAVLLKQRDYLVEQSTLSNGTEYIYYTREVTKDDDFYNLGNHKGNLLCRVKMGTNDEEILETESEGYTYDIKDFKNNAIYFVISDADSFQFLYKLTVDNFSRDNKKQLTDAGFTEFAIVEQSENTTYDYVVAKRDNFYYLINMVNGTANRVQLAASDITIVKIVGNDLYYTQTASEDSSTTLYKIDIKSQSFEPVNVLTDDTTYKVDAKLIDFDGRRVVLFTEYTNDCGTEDETDDVKSFYLNVIDSMDKEDGELVSKFMGEFKGNDKPQQPKDNAETTDVDESKDWVR